MPSTTRSRSGFFVLLSWGKLSWVQVALMIGGDNTPNTVCQIAHRGLNLVTFDPENNDTMKT